MTRLINVNEAVRIGEWLMRDGYGNIYHYKTSVLAQLVADDLKGKWAYVEQDKAWYRWAYPLWRICNKHQELIRSICAIADGGCAPIGYELETIERIVNMLELRQLLNHDFEMQYRVAFKNGILDTRTMELQPIRAGNAQSYIFGYDWPENKPLEDIEEWLWPIVLVDGDSADYLFILERIGAGRRAIDV